MKSYKAIQRSYFARSEISSIVNFQTLSVARTLKHRTISNFSSKKLEFNKARRNCFNCYLMINEIIVIKCYSYFYNMKIANKKNIFTPKILSKIKANR